MPLKSREKVIGEGVVKFLFGIFHDNCDSNYKGSRHEFVVIQRDGTIVLLHPHQGGKDAQFKSFRCK